MAVAKSNGRARALPHTADRLWREFSQTYLDRLSGSPRHLEAAKQVLDRFTRYMDPDGVLTIRQIDEALFRDFLDRRRNDSGRAGRVSNATLNRDIRYLNTALARAQQPTAGHPDRLGFAPADWSPPRLALLENAPIKRCNAVPDIAAVLGACRHAKKPYIPGVYPNCCSPALWWEAILLASILTGIRFASILRIPRPNESDLQQNRLRLPKSLNPRQCDEVYQLPEFLGEMIRKIPGEPGQPLFHWPYVLRHFYRTLENWQADAQIPPEDRVRPDNAQSVKPVQIFELYQKPQSHDQTPAEIPVHADRIEPIQLFSETTAPEDDVEPVNSRRIKAPLSAGTLERILAAARTLPGSLGEIPERDWWAAFILTVANSGLYPPEVLQLRANAYSREDGCLCIGDRKIMLHAHTGWALEALRQYEREMLFPWPKTSSMIYKDYAKILHKAGLPTTQKPFLRVRAVALDSLETLDRINPHRRIPPVPGSPYRADRPGRAGMNRPKPLSKDKDGAYIVRNDSPDTLKRYFAEVYEPLRLIGGSKRTVEIYRHVINRFSDFLGCDATVHHLDEDCLDRFKAWLAKRLSAASVNQKLRHLLALWRYAWKKRKVAELPRDVEFLPEFKKNPNAWSQEELGRLLEAASQTEGVMYGIPACHFWPALILTLYDTGLRISACLSLRSEDLDIQGRVVRATAETQKQRSDQIFQLHPQTLATVAQLFPTGRELIFNWNGQLRNIFTKFKSILRRAGLPTTEKDMFHRIRRTSATFLAIATSEDEAVKHMGHSHPNVTKAYLDRTKLHHRINAADAIPRPEWKGEAS